MIRLFFQTPEMTAKVTFVCCFIVSAHEETEGTFWPQVSGCTMFQVRGHRCKILNGVLFMECPSLFDLCCHRMFLAMFVWRPVTALQISFYFICRSSLHFFRSRFCRFTFWPISIPVVKLVVSTHLKEATCAPIFVDTLSRYSFRFGHYF